VKKVLGSNIIYRLVNAIVAFIQMILLARALGANGNGAFTILVANISILVLIIGGGVENGITYFIANKIMSKAKVMHSTFLIATIQIGIFILIYNGLQLFFSINIFEVISLQYGILYFVILLATVYLNAYFLALEQFEIINKATLVMMPTTCLYLININYFGTMHIVSGYIICQAILPILLLVYFLKSQKLDFKNIQWLDTKELKLLFSFSGFVLLINIIQFLAFRIDYWILAYYHTKTDVGIYALATRLIQSFWVIPAVINTSLFPIFTRMGINSKVILQKILSILFPYLLLFTVVVAIGSVVTIPWFFGQVFTPTILPFCIMLLGAMFFVFNFLISPFFSSNGLLKYNFYAAIICLVLITILDFILIPKYGYIGAAIATCIAYSVQGIVSVYYFTRYNNDAWHKYFTIKKVNLKQLLQP
jgi:O-antigen/teichoic acid export membrane protein